MLKKALLYVLVAWLGLLTLIGIVCIKDASATTVDEGTVGIVVRLGKSGEEVLYPGWHFTPLAKVVPMNTRWQKIEIVTQAFSRDMQEVDVMASLSYCLPPEAALKMYRRVGVDYADKIIVPLANEAIKSTFSIYSAEGLIQNRSTISEDVLAQLEEEMMFYEVKIKDLAIEDIDFSDAFTDAIESKQVATQKLLQAQTEQEQQTLVTQAEAEREKIKIEAEAENKRVQAQADAEATKIAADAEAYRLEMESTAMTEKSVWMRLVEKWNGDLPTYLGADTIPVVTEAVK